MRNIEQHYRGEAAHEKQEHRQLSLSRRDDSGSNNFSKFRY
jgi:hypothetical protein